MQHDPRPASGHPLPELAPRGWLRPTDVWLRPFLALPELALIEESCAAEIALHEALVDAPAQVVPPAALDAIRDADARANYGMFLAFRDALLAAGTLQAYYLALMRSGQVTIPPMFVERVVETIMRHLLDTHADPAVDAFEARAAELLFRPQRLTLADGRMLCADLATIDLLNETGGFGDVGRLLIQGNAPIAAPQMVVLSTANAHDHVSRTDRRAFVLDLTHEVATDIGHGLTFTMTRSQSGLKALARVLERWVAHLLGVQVAITPLQQIAGEAWRWHVGLDVESMALLNDLYEDRPVAEERRRRLISLFKLTFANPAEMRADIAGEPVYLGLAMTPEGTLRLKPQNLLLNLPLAASM